MYIDTKYLWSTHTGFGCSCLTLTDRVEREKEAQQEREAAAKAQREAAHAGELGRRLKAAGAMVGNLTCSLMWDDHDDLDLHCETPSGEHIFWNHKKGQCGGHLDVDMNASRLSENLEMDGNDCDMSSSPSMKLRNTGFERQPDGSVLLSMKLDKDH